MDEENNQENNQAEKQKLVLDETCIICQIPKKKIRLTSDPHGINRVKVAANFLKDKVYYRLNELPNSGK